MTEVSQPTLVFPQLEPMASTRMEAEWTCDPGQGHVAPASLDGACSSRSHEECYIEFQNASSFYVDIEVVWRNKRSLGDAFAGVKFFAGWIRHRRTLSRSRKPEDSKDGLRSGDSAELRGTLAPETIAEDQGTIRYVAPKDCKEVYIITRARIEMSDDPVTIKEKAYDLTDKKWELTSTDSRILAYFDDDDLKRLKRVRDERKKTAQRIYGGD